MVLYIVNLFLFERKKMIVYISKIWSATKLNSNGLTTPWDEIVGCSDGFGLKQCGVGCAWFRNIISGKPENWYRKLSVTGKKIRRTCIFFFQLALLCNSNQRHFFLTPNFMTHSHHVIYNMRKSWYGLIQARLKQRRTRDPLGANSTRRVRKD